MRLLGAGGMGAVYVVLQLSTERERALKVMLPELTLDADQRARFALEARVGSKIASDHVVEVLSAGVDEATGAPFLVMELLQGQTLQQRLNDAGRLPPAEVARLFEQLGHALGAAHAKGIVHRDLKPENIFLSVPRTMAAGSFVKVLDFGIAKLVGEGNQTQTGQVGTPSYMSPEQCRGESISAATDVWALGLIAFRLLTGVSYWKASHRGEQAALQLMFEIGFEPLVRASERAAELGCAEAIPAKFDAWFSRCVARRAADRFPDGGAAARMLVEVLERGADVKLDTLIDAPAWLASRSDERIPETNRAPDNTGRREPPVEPRPPEVTAVVLDAPAREPAAREPTAREPTAREPTAREPTAVVPPAPPASPPGSRPARWGVALLGAALVGTAALAVRLWSQGHGPAGGAPGAHSATSRQAASAVPSVSNTTSTSLLAAADVQLWLKADEIKGVADGGSVALWPDASGHEHHATQGIANRRPELHHGGPNGKPVVRFDGVNDHLLTPALALFETGRSPLTVFVVFRANSVTSQRFLVQQPQKNCSNNFELGYRTGLASSANLGLHAGCSHAVVTQGSLSAGVWYVATIEVAGDGVSPANVSFRRTGVPQVSVKNLQGWPAPGKYGTLRRKLVIAGRDDANTEGYNSFHDGDIAELMILSSSDATRRNEIEAYLRAKYAL